VTVPDNTQGSDDTGQSTGNEPPYAKELETLPEDVRPLVEPIFKNWDAQVTKRFQESQSTLEPWKEIVDSYEPAVVGEAIQLAQLLEADPKALYDLMAQTYQFEQAQPPKGNGDQGQQPPVSEEEDDPYAERFSKVETALEQLANILVANQNQATVKEQTELLDHTMTSLKEKYGDFDEDYVLNRLALGDDPDAAIQSYNNAIVNGLKARGMSEDQITAFMSANGAQGGSNNSAPVVTSGSGGTPSVTDGGKKPGEMSKGEVTDYVTEMLRQAAEANN